MSENLLEIIKQKVKSGEIGQVDQGFSESNEKSVVFYNLKNDIPSKAIFLQRLASSSFGMVIVRGEVLAEFKESDQIFFINDKAQFEDFEFEVMEILYPLPLNGLTLVGITGTNGKTTTVHFTREILANNGIEVLSVGTTGVWLNKTRVENPNTMTTPSFIDLRKTLYRYREKFKVLVMEVSSHSLIQGRVRGLRYDYAAWTSFTQDHLDYHQTMEAYFDAKLLLPQRFLKENGKFFVPSREVALREKLSNYKVSFKMPLPLNSSQVGDHLPFFQIEFNKSNLEIAVEISKNIIKRDISIDAGKLTTPEGRLEIHSLDGKTFVIDSAHTPNALENAILSVRKAFPSKKIFILFGCGGDRDRKKRPLMGEIASRYADHIFLTSDNLRNEDPDQIISDILPGIDQSKTTIEINREEAVYLAFCMSTEGTVCLLAGKGPEQYQIVKGELLPYSELGSLLMAQKRYKEKDASR